MSKEYTFMHDGVRYVFTTEAQENPIKTKLANGRKVYEDREVCYAHVPSAGSPKQVNSDLVTPDWLAMKDGEGQMDTPHTTFRDNYDRWKQGLEAMTHGTLLEDLADLTPAMIKTLEGAKIETLEQLVGVDVKAVSSLLGPKTIAIVEKAKALLAAKNPDMEAVNAKLIAQADEMEKLRAQIAELTAARAEPAPKPAKGAKAAAPAEAAA